jgi:bifunctional UDP-N-acetylglucosamine pyrophosphorylase / glucosamine-1-phosphate N-acetyltransferase
VGARTGDVAAVVLAAGDGKRLKSNLPKVLHPAAGRPLLAHVLAALDPLPLRATVVVRALRHELVEAAMAEAGFVGIDYVVQDPPRGTAHAARVGLDALGDFAGAVVIAAGDMPLLETDTFFRMLEMHRESGAEATMLTAVVHGHSDYGRVVRNGGRVERIVEARDATEAEKRIQEVNAGVYVFESSMLDDMLAKVGLANEQGEYYLTDVIGLLAAEGHTVATVTTDDVEVRGVNNRAQLSYVSGLIRQRVCERLMDEGVSIVDPHTTYIDTTVVVERDATIQPFTFLEGETRIGEGAQIGPQVRIVDSTVGSNAQVTFAVVRGSEVGSDSHVGPFASLRPGSVMAPRSKIGTFVESKNVRVGRDSKVSHLTYVGDTDIGERVNVGAGTVTCNWDGQTKHETVIDDDAYIGSDSMLVAPVRVGKRAATGAGTVVNKDVPDDALAVGVPARILEGRGDRMKRKKG